MKILRATDYRRMPWKNGGGETVEIAVFPDDAGLADFDWRISMATVATDGPFSVFPGIDRTLSILYGAGMTLFIEGRDPVLLARQSDPLPFPADAPTAATLVDGPITDLNVMSRRERYTHRVRRLVIDDTISIQACAGTTLVLGNSPWVILQPKAEMLPLDLLMLDGGETQLHPHDKYAVIFIVEIIPVADSSHIAGPNFYENLFNGVSDSDCRSHRAAASSRTW